MSSTEDKKPPSWWIALALLGLFVLSTVVAWRVPIPAKVPVVAWNSPWVFRSEVFVGFFIAAYILLAISATTVRTGKAPRKLSFGMVSYEEAEVEKTADALNEGQAALQEVQREVESLRGRMARTAASTRMAHEGLLGLVGDEPSKQDLSERARQEIKALQQEEAALKSHEPGFDRAMGKLEQTLRELDEMLERPRRARHAG